MPKDIILIDKSIGASSYDVIRQLKKKYPGKKIGHAGTLDPLASGLLLVAVGDTKKLTDLVRLSKTYEADILLGEKRTTGDLEGEVVEEVDVSSVADEVIKKTGETMVGIHNIPVPLYSAVKVNGKPLYWYARQGKPVEVPAKEMEVNNFKIKNIKQEGKRTIVSVEMSVGSGTYVRAIAEEFGRKLGVPATTASLRRTKIGEYDVRDAENVGI